MAWTYFTDYLEEGDILTYNQWKELVDALEERMIGTCSGFGWVGNDATRTDQYAIIDSKLNTLRADYTGYDGNVVSANQMVDLVFNLADVYGQNYEEGVIWADGLWVQAATDLGIPYSTYINMDYWALNDRLDYYQMWNMIRRCIQLLRYPYAMIQSGYNKTKYATNSNVATCASSFTGASESSETPNIYYCEMVGGSGGSGVELEGWRTNSTVEIPTHVIFDDYDAWIYLDKDTTSAVGSTAQTDKIIINFAGSTYSQFFRYDWAGSDDFVNVISLGTGRSNQGSLTFNAQTLSYTDSTAAEFVINQENTVLFFNGEQTSGVVTDSPGIYLAPTFTHPYEAIP